MILGFDIGNTHICPIFFNDDASIAAKFRFPTKSLMTEDTIYASLKILADKNMIDLSKVDDIVVSSVVPHLNEIFTFFSEKYFHKKAYFINIDKVYNKEIFFEENSQKSLGSDRIATVLAMQKRKINNHILIIDFGTAITFELIEKNKYLGGGILPGIELSINALFQNTAQLPKVSFKKPDTILANTTLDQINVGIYLSNIGAIKEIIKQYRDMFPDIYVVSTGGQGKQISLDLKNDINEYVPDLCEQGIYQYYILNKK